MKKNNKYAQFIKYFDKSADRLYVARFGEDIYISDGYILIKVNPLDYDISFRAEKPYYIAVEDGKGFMRFHSDDKLPELSNTPCRFDEIYNDALKTKKTVRFSPNVTKYQVKGKTQHIELVFLGDDDVMGVQEKYVDLFDSITDMSTGWVGKDRLNPVAKENVGVILPIRVDASVFADMTEMSERFEETEEHRPNVGVRLYKITDLPEDLQSGALDQINLFADCSGEAIEGDVVAYADSYDLMFDEYGTMWTEWSC